VAVKITYVSISDQREISPILGEGFWKRVFGDLSLINVGGASET
jgi:hypothetical protein